MRKLFVLKLVATLSVTLFAQSTDDTKFRVGAGTVFVSEVESYGVSATGIYEISKRWAGAVTFTHVFENVGLSWDIIDTDGHLVFYDNDKKFSAYALAGFALNFWRRETLLTKETITGSYMGMNIGAGMNIGIGERFNLAPELRGTLFDLSYTRIGVTIQYKF